jgi:hypothetical protein
MMNLAISCVWANIWLGDLPNTNQEYKPPDRDVQFTYIMYTYVYLALSPALISFCVLSSR